MSRIETASSKDYTTAYAFALTTAAGLATCIGGLVPFHRKLISLANPSRIGIALALSAGVMIFISLAEIFGKSVEGFEKGFSNDTGTACDQTIDREKYNCKGKSKSLATLCFLFGASLIFLLDFIVHKISPDHNHHFDVEEINHLNQTETIVENGNVKNIATQKSLKHTGILTAVAIGLHNLPEGIATFIAAKLDLATAFPIALGIALHNIPEGIAVATPVYFATKSRWKGLFYTFISALAEPLGGFVCWIILKIAHQMRKEDFEKQRANQLLNGVMFGIVTGMMVTISLKELIPTALRFCQSKGKISISMLVGMFIMALSLIIFDFAGVE
ncbi:hypothetical protein I4U23_022752 [Adineta vaga]|nr:hypothetical protein I4U23_022752 [Adineta vaga]